MSRGWRVGAESHSSNCRTPSGVRWYSLRAGGWFHPPAGLKPARCSSFEDGIEIGALYMPDLPNAGGVFQAIEERIAMGGLFQQQPEMANSSEGRNFYSAWLVPV